MINLIIVLEIVRNHLRKLQIQIIMIASKSEHIVRDVFDLQKAGVDVDTRLILDEGELAIHWSQNFIYGGLDQARL